MNTVYGFLVRGLMFLVVLSCGESATISFTLRDLGHGTPRAVNDRGWVTHASDINNAGVVVGAGNIDGNPDPHAYIQKPGQELKDIGVLPGGESQELSQATAINEAGQVVGFSTSGEDCTYCAFIYTETTGMQSLGIPGPYNLANDINESGQVVGVYQRQTSEHLPFLYTPGAGIRDLEAIIATGTNGARASAINDRGWIVGEYSTGQHHAFLYSPDGELTELGVSQIFQFGNLSINNAGWVVGSWSESEEQGGSAFLYLPGQGRLDLETLVPGLTQGICTATDINDRGQITGSYGNCSNPRAFLLTPISGIPEPTTWVLLGTSLLGLALYRRAISRVPA